MPWTIIGECGNGQIPRDTVWLNQCHRLAVAYLAMMLPPPGPCELDVTWGEFDSAMEGPMPYPIIGLYTEDEFAVPWDYVNRYRRLLGRVDETVKWDVSAPDAIADLIADDDDPDVDESEYDEDECDDDSDEDVEPPDEIRKGDRT